MWWHTLLIQACERQRWAICELEVSLVFEFSEFQGNLVGLSQKNKFNEVN